MQDEDMCSIAETLDDYDETVGVENRRATDVNLTASHRSSINSGEPQPLTMIGSEIRLQQEDTSPLHKYQNAPILLPKNDSSNNSSYAAN